MLSNILVPNLVHREVENAVLTGLESLRCPDIGTP